MCRVLKDYGPTSEQSFRQIIVAVDLTTTLSVVTVLLTPAVMPVVHILE